jgi:hypothetical protein
MTGDSAAERAAAVQAQMAHEQAEGGHVFPELGGVTVRGAWVYTPGAWRMKPFGFRSERLGPLAGACAGIIDARQPTLSIPVSAYLSASAPKAGTVFIAFADGTRHKFPARAVRVSKLRQAVDLFNAMADAATAKQGRPDTRW